MARSKPKPGGDDQLNQVAPGLQLEIHPNLKRITGFDQAALLAAIAEDRSDESFGLLTLWGWDLVWKLDAHANHPVLTVLLAADWPAA